MNTPSKALRPRRQRRKPRTTDAETRLALALLLAPTFRVLKRAHELGHAGLDLIDADEARRIRHATRSAFVTDVANSSALMDYVQRVHPAWVAHAREAVAADQVAHLLITHGVAPKGGAVFSSKEVELCWAVWWFAGSDQSNFLEGELK
jgi:hypothetical protein